MRNKMKTYCLRTRFVTGRRLVLTVYSGTTHMVCALFNIIKISIFYHPVLPNAQQIPKVNPFITMKSPARVPTTCWSDGSRQQVTSLMCHQRAKRSDLLYCGDVDIFQKVSPLSIFYTSYGTLLLSIFTGGILNVFITAT